VQVLRVSQASLAFQEILEEMATLGCVGLLVRKERLVKGEMITLTS
jgi:hypothetical protein